MITGISLVLFVLGYFLLHLEANKNVEMVGTIFLLSGCAGFLYLIFMLCVRYLP
jgi:hypothetical protein